MPHLLVAEGPDGRITITLDRPERHNAFDDALIAELTAAFERSSARASTRVIVLEARGESFSAGADLEWMKRAADYTPEENRRDALALARLLRTIDECPQPVVAVVQGAAYGGGVGLAAASDIVLAADTARFALTEVRLGLIPAVISPYVVAAIGARAARRYFVTAERFDAEEARRLGLVHEVVAAGELPAAREKLLHSIAQGGPTAQIAAKALVRELCAGGLAREGVAERTAALIAERRSSAEGRAGIAAFLEKRPAPWLNGGR